MNVEEYKGFYPISAFSGYGIVRIEHGIDDYVYVQYYYNGNEKEERVTRNKIYYSTNGRSYIVKNGRRLYLDEFLRN